jgi:adenosylmethionine-8-amino-7-oxononanoate aminotransferase
VYLTRACDLCEQYGVHLIADEIVVGMKNWHNVCLRTGRNHTRHQLVKGITGYLPLSVYNTDKFIRHLCRRNGTGILHRILPAIRSRPSCASPEIFSDDDVINANRGKAAYFNTNNILRDHPKVKHFRNRGMIWAFEVDSPHPDFAQRCFSLALQHEMLLRPMGNTVYFMPPYVISEAEMDMLVARTLIIIEQLT